MLASASRGAPYTCLRCQLRQAIFHTRRTCIERTSINTARSFSATPQRREQEDDSVIQTSSRRDDRGYVYHYPLGKIVGAPGRRQRQGTQKLKIDAMKQPFEVIVMQDVREPEESRQKPRNVNSGALVSGAQIERQMAKEGEEPTQDEVNESISAFRPDTTVLDEQQYKKLGKTLSDGFTIEQLHAFFTQSLNLEAIEGDTVHLIQEQPSELQARYRRTQWRPGRTRLEKRLPLGTVVTKSEKTNKPKLIEQIMRLTWKLTIHAEEQKVGELEMKLQAWELSYLFDLTTKRGGLMYQALVESDFLLRACSLQPYRPHSCLRISGRRQDAEEVAQKIETALPKVGLTVLRLQAMWRLIGTPGWPQTFAELYRKEDLLYIQEKTFTIIEPTHQGSWSFHIYGLAERQRLEARRLMLAMLELPTQGSVKVLNESIRGHSKVASLPEYAEDALHYRHRKLSLTRLVAPTPRKAESAGSALPPAMASESQNATSPTSTEVLLHVAGHQPLNTLSAEQQPILLWRVDHVQHTPWIAQLCKVLHDSGEDSSSSASGHGRKKKALQKKNPDHITVASAQIPRLEALLSFFRPRISTSADQNPHLIARFIPSPLTKAGIVRMTTLPPIEIAYRFTTDKEGNPDVSLVGARAMLDKQELRVPLPSQAVDVRFERQSFLNAVKQKLLEDGDVRAFTDALRTSLRFKKGNLSGMPHIQFKLPSTLVAAEDRKDGAYTQISYLFNGFEQTQKSEFVPVDVAKLPAKMDPYLKAVLGSFREGVYLQLNEVAAGKMGGRRVEVGLRCSQLKPKEQARADEGEREADASEQAADKEQVQTPSTARETGDAEEASSEGDEQAHLVESGVQEDIDPLNAALSTTAEDTTDKPLDAITSQSAPEDDEAARTERMVRTATGLTRLLTALNAGTLQPMLYHTHEWKEMKVDEKSAQ